MISWKGRVPANQLKLVVGGVPMLLTAAVISTCLAHSSDAHIPRTGEPAEGRTLFLLDAGYRLPMEITAIRNVGKEQWAASRSLLRQSVRWKLFDPGSVDIVQWMLAVSSCP
jgi:hypothetical protein